MTKLVDRIRRQFKKRRNPSLQERYPQYLIGKHSYGDLKVRDWGEGARLEIGSFCSFASGVKILLGGEHRADWVTTFPFPATWVEAADIPGHPYSKGDVTIGNDVWIGTEAIILSGVQIGDGAVIGARSVISQNVPPYAIVAGSPARLIRYRFEPELIERLIAVKWWNLSDESIRPLLPLLLSNNIEAFLTATEEVTSLPSNKLG